jgi:hypothetical protein
MNSNNNLPPGCTNADIDRAFGETRCVSCNRYFVIEDDEDLTPEEAVYCAECRSFLVEIEEETDTSTISEVKELWPDADCMFRIDTRTHNVWSAQAYTKTKDNADEVARILRLMGYFPENIKIVEVKLRDNETA